MRIPGTLFAMTVALVTSTAPVAGLFFPPCVGETTYVFETLATGDSAVVAEHGPITLTAVYGGQDVQMDLSVEATVDDLILVEGDDSEVGPLLAGETYTQEGVLIVSSSGNDIDNGGVMTGSGYYVGWDGESTLGMQRNDATRLEAFGEDVNCVIAGSLTLIEKE